VPVVDQILNVAKPGDPIAEDPVIGDEEHDQKAGYKEHSLDRQRANPCRSAESRALHGRIISKTSADAEAG
jgi:hypothetical protein